MDRIKYPFIVHKVPHSCWNIEQSNIHFRTHISPSIVQEQGSKASDYYLDFQDRIQSCTRHVPWNTEHCLGCRYSGCSGKLRIFGIHTRCTLEHWALSTVGTLGTLEILSTLGSRPSGWVPGVLITYTQYSRHETRYLEGWVPGVLTIYTQYSGYKIRYFEAWVPEVLTTSTQQSGYKIGRIGGWIPWVLTTYTQ